jgi:phage tail sheath protein FI
MPANSFKFVSPGIFLNEIDNSQIPQPPGAIGPTIIGRATKGRAMHPIKVDSFSDFVDQFGPPVAGGIDSDYRASTFAGPTYGVYGAQAYLAAGVGPVNFIRLLGIPHAETTDVNGEAGWTTYDYSGGSSPTAVSYGTATGGGAYGLFIAPSGTVPHTATLAAVFYVTKGGITLSGTLDRTGAAGTGSNEVVRFSGTNAAVELTAQVYSTNAYGNPIKFKFNLDRDSSQFARNVFNTNPVLTNTILVDSTSLTKNEAVYWLGETYETQVQQILTGSFSEVFAWLSPVARTTGSTLSDGYSYNGMKFSPNFSMRTDSNIIDARTGWFFSQDLSTDTASYSYDGMTKLFRFHGLDAGEWTQKNIKVSIENLQVSPNADVDPYGKFSVVVRSIRDTDASPTILERFDNVSLNPNSTDYIGVRIGDKTRKFDYTLRINKEYGQYDNQSRYIRVEVNPSLEEGLFGAELLPFGVYGPIRPKTVSQLRTGTTAGTLASMIGHGSFVFASRTDSYISGASTFTSSVVFPGTSQRLSASDGSITDPTKAYFGARTTISADSSRYDTSVPDCLRLYGIDENQNIGIGGLSSNSVFEHQWVFSLDDLIIGGSNNNQAYYLSGSRVAGTSKTALNASTTGSDSGYKSVINAGFARFTALFQGGSDGLNIQEAEPFQYRRLQGTNNKASAEYNSVELAIDLASDPNMLETNMIVVPGVRNSAITDKVITACENRADALAIIDIDDGYKASTEANATTRTFKSRLGSVSNAVTNLRARRINSSYACTYYPWVQIRDSINGQLVWVPPSVVALGTMASSERVSEVWFAPAGFNRGGLSTGAAGLPVVNVVEKLTSKQRDDLYAANINPIASFPSEGIVVFGQKTLQVTPSALDRINVRRLMIYVKKQISRFAANVLFDPNVTVTWNRFKAAVEPFLGSVQARLGLTEYRLILDETTTTPDLIDRNILYAKIYLKPARAIEFIAVDFVISRTGASFED